MTGKANAAEITSIFDNSILTRASVERLASNNTFTTKILGVIKVRESGDYYQWNKTTDNEGNTIWKVVQYPSIESIIPDYSNFMYCLNATRGFHDAQGEMSEGKDIYNIELSMTDPANKANIIKYSGGSLEQNFNKVIWIADNTYVATRDPYYQSSNEYKTLMRNAGITIDSEEKINLSEDDIEAIEQMVVWYFTNVSDPLYHSENLPSLYLNGKQLSSMSMGTDKYGRPISGSKRAEKANKLYRYFIENAEENYTRTTPSLSLTNTSISIEEDGDYYIIGPYSLSGENTTLIKSIEATANKEYTLLNSSKQAVNNNEFIEVLNSNFYLKVSKSEITSSDEIKLNLVYKHDNRDLIFTTDINDYENTQPVLIIKDEEAERELELITPVEIIDVEVQKIWDDNNNQDGIRSNSVKVQLYENGVARGNYIELNEANNWRYVWSNLLSARNYEVKELNSNNVAINNNGKYNDNYTVNYGIVGNKVTITNTHIPDVVEKTVTKIWNDGNDADKIRPTIIEVQLYKTINGITTSMGEEYKETLSDSNNWTKTWSKLPEKENGKSIKYTVQEVKVPDGYEVSYSEDTFIITNTHIPNGLSIQLQKVDEEGNIITSSEATFEISGEQTLSDQTNGGILDLDTKAIISNKFEFVYKIKELKAPIGYNGITEELTLKILGTTKFENGRYELDTVDIKDEEGNELDSTKVSASFDSNTNKVTIKIVNTKKTNEYFVRLLKVGEDGTTPLSGAWFKINEGQATLISEAGEEIASGTISESGELNLEYILEEVTAPEGYIKLTESKHVKISAKIEFQDDEYQITKVAMQEEIDGVTITEEDNVITIRVENEVEVTGKYNVAIRKVDENGNKLLGSKFEINGTEYDLISGEATILEDVELTSTDDIILSYIIKETQIPEGYQAIEDTTIYIRAKVQRDGNNYKVIRTELVDCDGNVISNESMIVSLEGDTIFITVENKPIDKIFDLALRKFIAQVNQQVYLREPVVDISTIATNGTATYKHIKEPIAVQKGDIITYVIRVYNEGELDGYVDMITDHLPENLKPIIDGVEGIDSEKYKDEIEFNSNWLWVYSDEGKTVTTTITSKTNSDTYSVLTGIEEVADTKLNAYVEGNVDLDYIDVQIKCLVADTAVSGEYLTNIAEIVDAQDINEQQGDGPDSIIGNADYSDLITYKNKEAIGSTEESYIEGQEDDDDFEKIFVKEFDLALRKFITKVNETLYSREPVVDTSKLGTVGVNGSTITTAIYNHSKEPVIVQTGDLVTYKIRIFNEGTLAGFANEITDDIPEGLEYLPNSSINVSYKWKMLDNEGNETDDVSKAVIITTDCLSDINKNNAINAVSEVDGVKTLSYKDVEVQFKVTATAKKLQDNIIINEAQISADSDRDIDSIPNRDEKYDYETGNNEDDIDYEPIKLQYFDLALRKFITKVNTTDYNNRYPEVIYGDDESITYKHTKDPVLVTTEDIVIYTIRVYNEGEKSGTATEITDNLPEGLEFLPDNDINKLYAWKLIDENGNETEDVSKAIKVTTNILEDETIDGIIKKDGQKILSYKDVQIVFKVIEGNTSDKILVNTAEISEDNGDDIDSIPDNQIEAEDDLDKEYVKVQYFDLALKKWVTATKVTYNGKTTTTKTGFTEDSEGIAKVDLVASKMKKTTVKFTYSIKVINEGELPGYAYQVKDYIPNGLKFIQEDNKDWKEVKDGVVVTDQLKDTLLNPGESATVEITLTWKNSTTNLALKTNYAEISEDSGNDIDSIPDNFNKKEDDIDDAQVILSIKTAGATTYVGLVLISVSILTVGIFLIKKYVIK